MASFVALPNKIGDLVFEHLNTPDFLHLSETCKQLHARTLPLAYKHLTLTWHGGSKNTRKSLDINKLVGVFRAKPELKSFVRRLSLETSGCVTRTEEGELLVNISGSEPADFYGAVEYIIKQCDQIERVQFSIVFLVENPRWFESLMHGIRESWTDNLKHVHLTRDDTTPDDWVLDRTIPEVDFIKLITLPHAEVVELDFCNPVDMWKDVENQCLISTGFWPWAQIKVSKYLHTLRISCCPSPTVAFELILEETPSLRIFDVEFYQHSISYNLELNPLKDGLDHVKSTLTYLRIRHKAFAESAESSSLYYAQMFESTCGSLGSFRDYNALTHLEVSLHILFDSRDSSDGKFPSLAAVLPPYLETLVITDDLQEFNLFNDYFELDHAMAMFERFFCKDWRTATPRLKEFTHDLRNSGSHTFDYWDKKSKGDELMTLCESQGIMGKVLRKS